MSVKPQYWEKDDHVADLEREVKALRSALEPFAAVIDWEERCRGEDRLARLSLTSLHITTRAFSSGYSLSDEPFRVAWNLLHRRER